VDTPDRLAAYLADELDPADRAALDDELARDGQLRAALAAMRRADAALIALDPSSPDEGFDARMDAFVDGVLAELDELEPAGPGHDPVGTPDGAATSSQTNRTGWVVAVAAAVVLLAGVGLATWQPFSGDDAADDAGAELSSADDAGGTATESTDEAMDGAGPMALPLQPTIVDGARVLDDDDLDALLDEPVLRELAGAGLGRDQGTDVGLELQRQLGQRAPDAPDDSAALGDDAAVMESDDAADTDAEDAPEAEQEAPAEDAEVAPRPDDGLLSRSGEPADAQLLADAQRCLGTLLEAGPTAIPVYLEGATVDGQRALVFGLVTIDPQDDGFTRREIWTLDRGTCQVLRFAQA
jgi:hypothetical protein